MAVFMFVTASMATIVGLVGLMAGYRPRTTRRKKTRLVSTAS
jgi:hypothetical protein